MLQVYTSSQALKPVCMQLPPLALVTALCQQVSELFADIRGILNFEVVSFYSRFHKGNTQVARACFFLSSSYSFHPLPGFSSMPPPLQPIQALILLFTIIHPSSCPFPLLLLCNPSPDPLHFHLAAALVLCISPPPHLLIPVPLLLCMYSISCSSFLTPFIFSHPYISTALFLSTLH